MKRLLQSYFITTNLGALYLELITRAVNYVFYRNRV
jgi:hypothetical protein